MWNKRNQLTLTEHHRWAAFRKLYMLHGGFQSLGPDWCWNLEIWGWLWVDWAHKACAHHFMDKWHSSPEAGGETASVQRHRRAQYYQGSTRMARSGGHCVPFPFLPWSRQNWWATLAPDYMTHIPVRETDPRVGHLSSESISPIYYDSLPPSFLILGLWRNGIQIYRTVQGTWECIRIIALSVYIHIVKQENQFFSFGTRKVMSSCYNERECIHASFISQSVTWFQQLWIFTFM